MRHIIKLLNGNLKKCNLITIGHSVNYKKIGRFSWKNEKNEENKNFNKLHLVVIVTFPEFFIIHSSLREK